MGYDTSMCGLFGAVMSHAAALPDAGARARALEALHHRGPDAAQTLTVGRCLLGHTRLAVLDLSAQGAQPMRRAEVTVVFNGEIYNHHALRAELQALGHQFSSQCDTEVIVHGVRAWGSGLVAKLDGMFAFAAWDAAAQRLLLARDRAGKKPLFFAQTDAGLMFASEPKALAALGAPMGWDPAKLSLLLTLGYVPAPLTLYQHIEQLEPGHLALLDANKLRAQRYYSAPFDAPRIETRSEDAARNVRELVEHAVRRRMEADVPLGAFLSGGIDSTIVAGVMQQQATRPVKTFSLGFSGDASFDETAYARIAARALGTDHTELIVEPTAFGLIERLVEMHDGPFGDASAIPTSIVAALARQQVTVALSGDGGDELFCGYTRFLAAEAADRVPPLVRFGLHRASRALPLGTQPKSLYQRGVRFAQRASLPFADRLLAWCSYFQDDALLRPELRAGQHDPWAWSRAKVPQAAPETVGATLGHNYATYLPYDLLVKADRASMMHSLEVRSPFLDTALVDYAARLPARMLRRVSRRGVETKWILKEAFRHVLPKTLRYRAKMGFGVPLGAWMRGALREQLRDRFSSGALLYEWLRPDAVQAVVAKHLAGDGDFGLQLWLLMTLEIWLQQRRTNALRMAAS